MSAPPPRSSAPLARVLLPLAAVVIVVGVVGLLLLGRGSSVAVGDCVAAGDGEVVVVDCGDAAATFRVIGVLDDVRPVDSQPACLAAFPRTTASYSEGGLSAEPAQVLCLVAA
ncbi:hypothetical protein SAMN05660199_03278 [Klenkia soli]|uniref:Uncharacterized protein n=1 Tax=Klenkia soli TaxID=1052260 RepID=A0A1H0QBG8_9ACTN|nr:hypothetical protein [Klenkia soli]SDP14674.1 hypothetical protein SAMN05660199_03278 [Klenkia soli]